MHSTVKPSFRYQLEKQKPRIGSGGTTRGASVHEFPASIGIAGVSMRLEAGRAVYRLRQGISDLDKHGRLLAGN